MVPAECVIVFLKPSTVHVLCALAVIPKYLKHHNPAVSLIHVHACLGGVSHDQPW